MRPRDRVGSIVEDLRFAIRQARRASGFTALSIGTLALGLGLTTAMFTLVERVLLRPLPFPHAERVVSLAGQDSARNRIETVSSADWLDWRRARALESSAIYSFAVRQGVVSSDSATRVDAERVSGDFFTVLRPHFVAGRGFTDEDVRSQAAVVVISEHLWRTMFGADPRLATPLRTASRSYAIVGVVENGQEFPAGTELWFPVAITPGTDPARVNVNWRLIARLRPDATVAQAEAELTTIARGIRANDPTALYDYAVGATSLTESVVGPVSSYLQLLMAVVACILLIVCANVAASSLARGAVRSREMAVRTSLGATRRRLVQQLLIEHALARIDRVARSACASAGCRCAASSPSGARQLPRVQEIAMDAPVFGFAVACLHHHRRSRGNGSGASTDARAAARGASHPADGRRQPAAAASPARRSSASRLPSLCCS